jgi:hypothetical protein
MIGGRTGFKGSRWQGYSSFDPRCRTREPRARAGRAGAREDQPSRLLVHGPAHRIGRGRMKRGVVLRHEPGRGPSRHRWIRVMDIGDRRPGSFPEQ